MYLLMAVIIDSMRIVRIFTKKEPLSEIDQSEKNKEVVIRNK